MNVAGATAHGEYQQPAGRWPTNVVLDESQADELDQQTGGASRYFPTFRYQAKAPKRERPKVDGVAHPTVKPLDFMRWLVRLVTPPGGVVLDPFAGSGTTVEAALQEGVNVISVERQDEYLPLIEARIDRFAKDHDSPVSRTKTVFEPIEDDDPVSEQGVVEQTEAKEIVGPVVDEPEFVATTSGGATVNESDETQYPEPVDRPFRMLAL